MTQSEESADSVARLGGVCMIMFVDRLWEMSAPCSPRGMFDVRVGTCAVDPGRFDSGQTLETMTCSLITGPFDAGIFCL